MSVRLAPCVGTEASLFLKTAFTLYSYPMKKIIVLFVLSGWPMFSNAGLFGSQEQVARYWGPGDWVTYALQDGFVSVRPSIGESAMVGVYCLDGDCTGIFLSQLACGDSSRGPLFIVGRDVSSGVEVDCGDEKIHNTEYQVTMSDAEGYEGPLLEAINDVGAILSITMRGEQDIQTFNFKQSEVAARAVVDETRRLSSTPMRMGIQP